MTTPEEGPLGGAGPAGDPVIIALTKDERAAAVKAEQKVLNKRAKQEGQDKVNGKKAKEDKKTEGQQKATMARKKPAGSGNGEKSASRVQEEDKDKEEKGLEPMPMFNPFDVDKIFEWVDKMSQHRPRTLSVREDKDKEPAGSGNGEKSAEAKDDEDKDKVAGKTGKQGNVDKSTEAKDKEGKSTVTKDDEDTDKDGKDHDDEDGKVKGKGNSPGTFAGRPPPKNADKLNHFCGVRDAYNSVLLEAGVHLPTLKQRDFMNFVQQRHSTQDVLDYRALACEWLLSQEPKKRKGASQTDAGAAPHKMVKQSSELAK